MNKILLSLFFIIVLTSFNTQSTYIEPTGTYKFNGIYEKKDGDFYGYSGEIQVKKINSEKIIMSFEVNKGAPSYNSGSFVDTLIYKENRAIYTNAEFDTSCKITFSFDKKGITVKEETADYNFGCGFGHGVVADGYYKKVSKKVPILIDLMTGEKIEK
jgi:hypothetical protein